MKTYYKNPREITKKQIKDLKEWLNEFGDLSGIVHDINSDETITGNQRSRVININECEIVLTEQLDEPDEQGTVATGYAIWNGFKYNYRAVDWTARQCEQANIIANKSGGKFDFDILANEFELPDLLEWGFEPHEFGLDSLDDFSPVEENEQPKLDELKPVMCPHCGKNIHEEQIVTRSM